MYFVGSIVNDPGDGMCDLFAKKGCDNCLFIRESSLGFG